MTELSDEQLITLFVDGDNRAFDTLHARYNECIYSYVMSLVKDVTLADDLVQDTYIKVMLNLKLGRYSHVGKFSNWMMSVAHNVVFDYYRSLQSQCVCDHLSDEAQFYRSEAVVDDSYSETIEREERFLSLEEAVSRLSDEQREIISLHYFNGESFKNIASSKNISINTALGRMHYAVQNLRKTLGKVAMM